MSRKVQMQRVWREGQRRSPRICALEATRNKSQSSSKSNNPSLSPTDKATCFTTAAAAAISTKASSQSHHHPRPPTPSRTTRRPKKKRKVLPLHDVASTPPFSHQEDIKTCNVQDSRHLSHEDHPINSNHPIMHHNDSHNGDQATYPDQPSRNSCASWMPEKRVLELVIDILQRKDTHEIFGEPVDPEEVEYYYEIIDEPMDFGTLRAKLHEGMYKSLAQFEHDVFLITTNAMHFNSATTIYFRQARAIDKLAKEVFHLLKTDPENFELKFSETRGRSSRRPQIEARADLSPKFMTCSTRSSSKLRRPIREHLGSSSITILPDERDNEVLFGVGDGRLSHSSEADKRSTYKPCDSTINQYHPSISTIFCGSEKLMRVNQQDIGYYESLMLFVKDLGPTAQMIAKRKLNGWSSDACSFLTQGSQCWPNCPNSALMSAQETAATLNTEITVTTSRNLGSSERTDTCDADERKRDYAGDKMGIRGTLVEVTAIKNDKKSFCSIRDEAHAGVSGVRRNDKLLPNPNSGIQLDLEDSQSNALACSWSSDNNRISLSAGMSSSHQIMRPTCNGDLHGHGSSSESGLPFKLSEQHLTPASTFRFGLPFFKSRLDQINSSGLDRFSHGSSGSQRPFMDRMIGDACNDNDSHAYSSLDARRLALRL